MKALLLPRWRRNFSGRVWLLAASCAVFSAGCGDASKQPAASPPPAANTPRAAAEETAVTAEGVLAQMQKVYRAAKTYQDQAKLYFRLKQAGQTFDEKASFAVAFARPNRIALEIDNLWDAEGSLARVTTVLRNDGQKTRAFAKGIAYLDHQILELESPAALTWDNAIVDESLNNIVMTSLGQRPLTMALLLGDKTLDQLTADAKPPILLPTQNFESQPCRRVRIDSDFGSLVLWIDQATSLLRRVDFPIEKLKQGLEGQAGKVDSLELYAEFHGAQVDAPIPDAAFQLEAPASAKLVKRLIGPPPSAPTNLLGKQVPLFKFKNLDGQEVTRETLAGKIAVLEFWFTDCEPCQKTFPLVNTVFRKYKDSDKVTFLAVHADENPTSDQTVRDTAKQWGSEFTVVRDPNKDIANRFEISQMPAMFVLGPDGTVQHYELGLNPRLAEELPQVIEAILSGKNPHEELKKKYDAELANFERFQQTPPNPAALPEQQQKPAAIAPRSEPTDFRLTKLWNSQEAKSPGGLLLVPATETSTAALYALDGTDKIVALDPQGVVAGRFDLAISPENPIAALRSGVGADGKRVFVGFLSGSQQLHLFDADWKKILSYPAPDVGKHEGIADVQIGDLDGDGKLELAVGFWGETGVQVVSLNGERIWRDRTIQLVLSMAMTAPPPDGPRLLLCTNNRGSITPFDAAGKAGADITIVDRPLQSIHLAADPAGARFCGRLASADPNANAFIGFNLQAESLWQYDLPSGMPARFVEPVTATQVLGLDGPQWLFAAPDGSIHLVGGDGKGILRFNFGAALSGLAARRIGERDLLFVASENGVEAYEISRQTDPQVASPLSRSNPE